MKNPAVFDSYRAIAGASQLLKLFEYVILTVWGDCLQSDSMQFGFKKGVFLASDRGYHLLHESGHCSYCMPS